MKERFGVVSPLLYARLRWVPVVLLLCVSVLVWLLDLDRLMAREFFRDGVWIGKGWGLSAWIYRYGPLPAILLGSISLALLGAAVWWMLMRRNWRVAAFYAVSLILGPGLLVNAVFKDNFGRPRPTNVVEFGGQDDFQPLWVPAGPGAGKSFPSGHASMGFFLMAPCFVLAAKRRRLATAFLVLGIAAGFAVGAVRVAQGGHWFSDVVWSGGFVYFVCLFTAWAFGFLRKDSDALAAGRGRYSVVQGKPPMSGPITSNPAGES